MRDFVRMIESKARWIAGAKTYDLQPVDQLIKASGTSVEQIFGQRECKIEDSRFFGSEASVQRIEASENFTSPNIYVFSIDNVEVMGWTDFVIKDGVAYHPDEARPRDDVFVAELERRATFNKKKSSLRLLPSTKIIKSKRAVSLLGQSSTNYAHWITEVLPKLVLLKDRIDHSEYDVLVDWHLHENLVSSMVSLGMNWKSLKFVKPWQRVKVTTLLYVSAGAYTPPDNRQRFEEHKFPRPQNRSSFSPEMLTTVRDVYRDEAGSFEDARRIRHVIQQNELKSRRIHHDSLENVGLKKKLRLISLTSSNKHQIPRRTHSRFNPKRLMFLRSASSHNGRHCENLSALIPLLEDYGFCRVLVDNMTFDEQLALMDGVECVASLMGASLANLTFAPPSTKVIILSPFYENADYSYFRHFMGALGHNTAFVVGKQIPSRERTQLTANYKIDLSHLQDALKFLLSQKPSEL